MTLTPAQIQKANTCRTYIAGYIGGREIAGWATDEEIIALIDLQDEHAELQRQVARNREYYKQLTKTIYDR